MRKLGLLLGFLMVSILVIRINVINSNRLASDNLAFNTRQEHLESKRELDEAINRSKVDMFRDINGYTNKEETVYIPNPTDKQNSLITVNSFYELQSDEPLFIRTNKGSKLTLPFNNFEWEYDNSFVSWDGETISYNPNDGDRELVLYTLFIDETGTEMLENIYNLDYYTSLPVTDGTYKPVLDGQVGILVELKDSAVVRYTILNYEIEDYDWIKVYDIWGNELIQIDKNLLRKTIEIEGTGLYEEVEGHLVTLNFEDINSFSGDIINHKQSILNTKFSKQVIYPEESEFLVELGTGVGEVTLEIYGTDIFNLKFNYRRLVKE